LAILIFGGIVVAYTLIGGLWAVLIVDVLQFIVLNLAVLFVVVLSLKKAGGLGKFIDAAPEGFFAPVAGQYAWWFLAGWCAIHFFTIGAELAFVQRYLCVPTEKDARKGAYLFGVLYLVSPLLWMLPPMLWRIGSPIPAGATLEQINVLGEHAYIQQCKAVLPAGMIGMMLAAMFSATASTVSGQLNVFAGVLTNDIYRPLRSAVIGEQHLVWIGRLFTLILGLAIVAVALSVPRLGGAEGVVIGITIAAVGPLTAPVLWGLLNRRVNAAAVWVTAAVCLPLVILAKLGPVMAKWSSGGEPLSQFWQWLQANQLAVDIALGALLPVIVLTLVQAASRGIAIGWQQVATLPPVESLSPATKNTERLPAQVVGWSLAACSATMTVLTLLNDQNRGTLGTFAAGLFVIAAIVLMGSRSTRSDRYAEVCTERTLEHVDV
jgi:SSS family solute:Na+ symporter